MGAPIIHQINSHSCLLHRRSRCKPISSLLAHLTVGSAFVEGILTSPAQMFRISFETCLSYKQLHENLSSKPHGWRGLHVHATMQTCNAHVRAWHAWQACVAP